VVSCNDIGHILTSIVRNPSARDFEIKEGATYTTLIGRQTIFLPAGMSTEEFFYINPHYLETAREPVIEITIYFSEVITATLTVLVSEKETVWFDSYAELVASLGIEQEDMTESWCNGTARYGSTLVGRSVGAEFCQHTGNFIGWRCFLHRYRFTRQCTQCGTTSWEESWPGCGALV